MGVRDKAQQHWQQHDSSMILNKTYKTWIYIITVEKAKHVNKLHMVKIGYMVCMYINSKFIHANC